MQKQMSTIGYCDLKDTADSKKKRKIKTKEVDQTKERKEGTDIYIDEGESLNSNSFGINEPLMASRYDKNIELLSFLEI